MEQVQLRTAKIGDCDIVMELMREFAKEENELDSMQLNAEDLRRDGFGEKSYFGCVVAENVKEEDPDGCLKNIIGYALYFYTYSHKVGKCVYIEDLYVLAIHRRKGIGERLLKEVAKVASESGCYRLTWGCLDWNTDAIEFYKRQGAVDVTDTRVLTFDIDQPNLAKYAMS